MYEVSTPESCMILRTHSPSFPILPAWYTLAPALPSATDWLAPDLCDKPVFQHAPDE